VAVEHHEQGDPVSGGLGDAAARFIRTHVIPAGHTGFSDEIRTQRQVRPRSLHRDALLRHIVAQLHEDAIRQYWLEQARRPLLIASIVEHLRSIEAGKEDRVESQPWRRGRSTATEGSAVAC
jgi:hypothetical protein